MNKYLSSLIVIAVAVFTVQTVDAKTLSIGSSGTDVAELQSALIERGYSIPLVENGTASKGYFGTQTQSAVMAYQLDNETEPNGVIDSEVFGRTFGAVSGPISPYAYTGFGGAELWGASCSKLMQGSSTVCIMQSPTSTSTLVSAGVTFTLASTSAVSVDIAKGTTRYATTTKIGSTYGIAASAQATIVASTTGSVAGDGPIFAPNTFLLIRFNEWSSTSGAGNVPTGKASAVWMRL